MSADAPRGSALTGAEFEDAFAALTDGVLLADERGVIRSANPAAFRLLGEDILVGKRVEDLLLVSGAARIQETPGHLVRRGWFPHEERMGVLEIISTTIGTADAPRGTIHTLRDVTAQAELLRLKEEFLLQVAHELRTPIAALSASLDLVLQDALTMSREELRAMMGTLQRSALRLERLVENLLDAGSIEAGTFQVRTIPVSLRRTLEDALEVIEPILVGKKQELVREIGQGSDRVLADPRRTAQVFSNLLSNASKYSPEGTRVTISAESIDGFVKVHVRDEGRGVPPEEQGRLFQRFFRSRLVRDEAGGLGLGLTICRAIVLAQGGEIGIESVEGGGTTVHFTLPKARGLTEEAHQG